MLNATYVGDPNNPIGRIHFILDMAARNAGKIRATNIALLIAGNIPISTSSSESMEYFRRVGSKNGTVLLELKNSFFPEMELTIAIPLVVEGSVRAREQPMLEDLLLIGDRKIEDVTIAMTCFADSAPPRTQEFSLAAADYDHKFQGMLREQLRFLR